MPHRPHQYFLAAQRGYLSTLQTLEPLFKKGQAYTVETLCGAVLGNDMGIITWVMSLKLSRRGMERVVYTAAQVGNLALLKYLEAQHLMIDCDAALYAAQFGHVHVLQWLWDKGLVLLDNPSLFERASVHRTSHALRWLVHKNNSYLRYAALCLESAIMAGSYHVYAFVATRVPTLNVWGYNWEHRRLSRESFRIIRNAYDRHHNPELFRDVLRRVGTDAARLGCYNTVEWLLRTTDDATCRYNIVEGATSGGHVHILYAVEQYIHSRCALRPEPLGNIAVRSGSLEMVQFIWREMGPAAFDDGVWHGTCSHAAKNGDLPILEWLCSKGQRRTGSFLYVSIMLAYYEQHWHIVNWMLRNDEGELQLLRESINKRRLDNEPDWLRTLIDEVGSQPM